MVRVKSKFHRQDKPKSIETVAEALGYNSWKIADKTVDNLYSEGFNFQSKAQILDVIGEFVTFMIQTTDRLAHGRMNDEQRGRFIGSMAGRIITAMVDNLSEIHGNDEDDLDTYKKAYIAKLNQRLDNYAEFGFKDGQPSYQALRYFANAVDEAMGGEHNKWVVEQIIEVECPELVKTLTKNMDELLVQSEIGGDEVKSDV